MPGLKGNSLRLKYRFMIELRPFLSLGRFQNDWLNAHYHFSFADYADPARVSWGKLRVWNDDEIRAGTGFPPHGHRDMEIVTYIRKGVLTHEDGLGNRGHTRAGDVQVMSAGSGITHSEFNLEGEDALIFQIWIMTAQKSAQPRWENRQFPGIERSGRWVALASGRTGDGDALRINQDAAVLGAHLEPGETVDFGFKDRFGYLVPAKGRVRANGLLVDARDGLAIAGEERVVFEAIDSSELVLVETA
ncbi:putative Quercetin 2,3-dioxygenase [Rhodospirillaceae bacterium LM-1]|nr:putative Quercetin 2,3-dioxygenase [Rhodospirillaceae bacterium LM-1]